MFAPTSRRTCFGLEAREDGGEGRAVDSLDDAHDHLRDDHRGARVARREHAARAPVADALGRDADGRAALLPDRGDRGLVEEDDLVRVHDAHPSSRVARPVELGFDLGPPPDEQGVEAEVDRRGDRPLHVDAGSVVAPHGVDGDRQATSWPRS
jgi:hypothetical protein